MSIISRCTFYGIFRISSYIFSTKSNLHFRGIVHCLKLSPNLRRQAPDVRTAILSRHSEDKILRLKTKVLSNILEMVVKPKESDEKTEKIEAEKLDSKI